MTSVARQFAETGERRDGGIMCLHASVASQLCGCQPCGTATLCARSQRCVTCSVTVSCDEICARARADIAQRSLRLVEPRLRRQCLRQQTRSGHPLVEARSAVPPWRIHLRGPRRDRLPGACRTRNPDPDLYPSSVPNFPGKTFHSRPIGTSSWECPASSFGTRPRVVIQCSVTGSDDVGVKTCRA